MKKLFLVLLTGIMYGSVHAQCDAPTSLNVTNVGLSGATFSWNSSTAMGWEIVVVPLGAPAPIENTVVSAVAFQSVYTLTGLSCGFGYDLYVRAHCGTEEYSTWSGPLSFSTSSCLGWINDIHACDEDQDGSVVVDLEAQTQQIILYAAPTIGVAPENCEVTYHLSPTDADAGVNELPLVFVTMASPQPIFVRIEELGNPSNFTIENFAVFADQIPHFPDIPNNEMCDNGSGSATFDLSLTSAYIHNHPNFQPTWQIAYFETLADAESNSNPIVNNIYMNVVNNQVLYVRIQDFISGCYSIETVTLALTECTGIHMNAFVDSNNNGTYEVGEPNFPYGSFSYEINDNSEVHTVSSPDGSIVVYDEILSNVYDLSYTVDATYAANYAVFTPSISNVALVNGQVLQYSFPIAVVQSYDDLSVSIIPLGSPQPGFQYTNKIVYTNSGTQTVALGSITFTNDPIVTIVGTSQAGIVMNPNGFTFDFADLHPFETREMYVYMQVPTIPTVALGNLITNSVAIVPNSTDATPQNNSAVTSQTIIGSYDPNDKMEAHGGQIVFSDFSNSDYLEYTIRFENSGTANAQNINVVDILDSSLNEESVIMVGASHDYTLERNGTNLSWTFSNVQLPPTIQDAVGSHGYIQFKVKPKTGYAIGDVIPNTASIYFDFNPVIVTNTFTSTFVSSLENPLFNDTNFSMYPNPAGNQVTVFVADSQTISKVSIYDMIGKNIVSARVSGTSSETIDVSEISSGIYFVEVTVNNSTEVKKLVIK